MTHLLALLGILGISFSAIFVRLADVSPSTAAFFRTAYAIPALVAVWWVLRRRDRRTSGERWLAFGSGLLLAVDLTLWHQSIADIGAGLATVVANIQVVFVGLAAWFLHRERPTRAAFVLVPVVFGGVVLISGLGQEDAFGANPVAGAIYATLAGVAYGGFLLALRRSNRSLAPPAGPLLDSTVGAALGSLAVAVLDSDFTFGLSGPEHGWLIGLALSAQVVGWLLITVALPRLPALETSVMLLLQPVATVVWALILFEEFLSMIQWIGAGLVLGGVGVLTLMGSVEPAREAEPVAEQVPL